MGQIPRDESAPRLLTCAWPAGAYRALATGDRLQRRLTAAQTGQGRGAHLVLRDSPLLCGPLVGRAGWLVACQGRPRLSTTKLEPIAATWILIRHHPATRWAGSIVRLCVECSAGLLSTCLRHPIRMLTSPEHGDPISAFRGSGAGGSTTRLLADRRLESAQHG